MKSAIKNSASLSSVVLACLLATAGAGVMAQSASGTTAAGAPSQPAARGERMEHHDPARMQAMMAKHQAALKAQLKLTPAQEGAWTSYTAAMQPPAHTRPTAEQRAEFDKLTTPQRIDKMRSMRSQRMTDMNAAMDRRGDATKAFYAALTPEQQKVFDAEQKKHWQHGGPGRHHEGSGADKTRG
jgi:periplasmic protein CpxP/Spy